MDDRCLPHWSFARLFVLTILLSLFWCCGGSPARPSDAGPALAILSSTDVLRVGVSVDMTLQVVFSDGRNTLVTPTWATDRPDIVHVKPLSASRQGAAPEDGKTGVVDHVLIARVTGLAPGDAMVTAESRYGTCRRPIHVDPE